MIDRPPITLPDVSRVEVIAEHGRVYTSGTRAFEGVRVYLQDDDRTLKIIAADLPTVSAAAAWDAAIEEACGPDRQKARNLKDANPYR